VEKDAKSFSQYLRMISRVGGKRSLETMTPPRAPPAKEAAAKSDEVRSKKGVKKTARGNDMDYGEIRTLLKETVTAPHNANAAELRNAQEWLAARINPQPPDSSGLPYKRDTDIAQEEIGKVLQLLAAKDFEGAAQVARKALVALGD
jgi:hypothetical protein